MENKKFKIREIATGLYWNGKVTPVTGELRWTKSGKTWESTQKLSESIEALKKLRIPISPLWEVVEFEKTPATGERYPASILSSGFSRF